MTTTLWIINQVGWYLIIPFAPNVKLHYFFRDHGDLSKNQGSNGILATTCMVVSLSTLALPIQEAICWRKFSELVPTLVDCLSTTCTFDLWMFNWTCDVFAIVVNFILSDWEAKHVTIGLFEVTNITGVAMVFKL